MQTWIVLLCMAVMSLSAWAMSPQLRELLSIAKTTKNFAVIEINGNLYHLEIDGKAVTLEENEELGIDAARLGFFVKDGKLMFREPLSLPAGIYKLIPLADGYKANEIVLPDGFCDTLPPLNT